MVMVVLYSAHAQFTDVAKTHISEFSADSDGLLFAVSSRHTRELASLHSLWRDAARHRYGPKDREPFRCPARNPEKRGDAAEDVALRDRGIQCNA